MEKVAVDGRGLIRAVLQLVGVADHLGEVGREGAELHALAVGGEVNRPVDERPRERQIRVGPLPGELREEGVQAGFVLLLKFVDAGLLRVGHAGWLSTRSSPTAPRPDATELMARLTGTCSWASPS